MKKKVKDKPLEKVSKNKTKESKLKQEINYIKSIAQLKTARTAGQRASDWLTKWAGSWFFIILFLFFIIVWMFINGYYLIQYKQGEAFDPFPFILLNLALSCLAALQAPIILMSQNRQTQRDRIKAEFDYRINKKAEREIREIRNLLLRKRYKK